MFESLEALVTVKVLIEFEIVEIPELIVAIGVIDIDKVLLALKAVEILAIIEVKGELIILVEIVVEVLKPVKPQYVL